MAKFNSLSEIDKIQSIKEEFVLLLEIIVKTPSKLKDILKSELPKQRVAALKQIKSAMSEEEKNIVKLHNEELIARVNFENEKLNLEFAAKEDAIIKIISTFAKKAGCKCGLCFDAGIINSALPIELEPLLSVAKKEAEERIY